MMMINENQVFDTSSIHMRPPEPVADP